jgi:hypothetical protein
MSVNPRRYEGNAFRHSFYYLKWLQWRRYFTTSPWYGEREENEIRSIEIQEMEANDEKLGS